MIAQELEVSLHMAFVEARQQRHEFITVEHLLMALLDNPSAAEVLRACAANIEDLRKSLSTFIKENTPTVSGTEEVDTQPTLGFQRVIQRAIMHVQSTGSGKKEVTGANVLVAIFGEKDSHAVYYLHQQGVTRLDVVNFIAHGIKKTDPPEPAKNNDSSGNEGEREEGGDASTKGSPLDQFTQNLNQQARDGKIDPLIGREHEVERVIQVLCARTTRCWSAKPAWARRRSPRALRGGSPRATCPRCWPSRPSMRSTWARCWLAPSTAATSSSA
jgi:ATP-dependent Clp protease ATP-binding subunit ClpA